MRQNWIWGLAGLLLAVGVISCTPAEPPTPAPTQGIPEETMAVSSTTPQPANQASKKLVSQAMEDLAGRLSVHVDEIELVESKSVIWPDSSMGCPKPGMAYTQVQHDGLLLRLQVGDRVYEYHSGGSRPPFLCEQAAKGK
ncbi:MAG: hypothetical protein ACE5HA_18860 [Anaerolineae bacterium]